MIPVAFDPASTAIVADDELSVSSTFRLDGTHHMVGTGSIKWLVWGKS